MSLEPNIEDRKPQPYAAIRTQATMREWGKVNALIGEVAGWLAQRNISPAGPPVYRYWKIGDMDRQFDLEVGWLVNTPVESDGRVQAGEIPAGRYVAVSHIGHPDKLEETFAGMMEWAEQQGVELATRLDGDDTIWEGRFELYMTDPQVEPDLNRWRTDVLFLTRQEGA